MSLLDKSCQERVWVCDSCFCNGKYTAVDRVDNTKQDKCCNCGSFGRVRLVKKETIFDYGNAHSLACQRPGFRPWRR